ILYLLKEVETRKLYCDFKCKSLFDYATKILKYSEAEAYTRINTMKLMREIPEIKIDLEKGRLTLTNAAQAHSFFKKQKRQCAQTSSQKQQIWNPGLENQKIQQPLTVTEKREILKNLQGQSTRKAKTILSQQVGSEELYVESTKNLSSGKVELRFAIDEDTFKGIQKLKSQLSQPGEALSYEALIKRVLEKTLFQASSCAPKKPRINNRTLTPVMRTFIKTRDNHSCNNCGSHFQLEVDHIQPQALGGQHHPDNLQTLCRPCNQRRAVKTFGLVKI
ncbi:MAG: HNH endonuclease, partial [Bdellovibrionales bacterium]|nr:HNH endonuclease [Bdellovibrionales bacterium]